jgi:CheY-like chemotaxis protein
MDVPVIMLSSTAKDEDRNVSYAAGCDYFLPKPIDRNMFLAYARKFIIDIDRREKRVASSFDGTLFSDNSTIPIKLLDISVGGAYIVSNHHTVTDSVIQLNFVIPDGTRIECHARVAWVNRIYTKIPQGFGVKFALMNKKAEGALKKFISIEQSANKPKSLRAS